MRDIENPKKPKNRLPLLYSCLTRPGWLGSADGAENWFLGLWKRWRSADLMLGRTFYIFSLKFGQSVRAGKFLLFSIIPYLRSYSVLRSQSNNLFWWSRTRSHTKMWHWHRHRCSKWIDFKKVAHTETFYYIFTFEPILVHEKKSEEKRTSTPMSAIVLLKIFWLTIY
jgi:hypothetical protein